MSHTNSTSHYNLPQFITTDKPAWLTDVNNAYLAIDAGMHAAKLSADSAQGDATQALTDAGTAITKANTADGKAGGALASISEDFLDSATYDVGDLVMYNNLLYVCHTAVVVPGAWTGASNWSRTNLDTVAANVRGDIPSNSDFDLNNLGDVSISGTPNGKYLYNDNGTWKDAYLPEFAKLAYWSNESNATFNVPIAQIRERSGRSFGMALVFAWKDIFALFYMDDNTVTISSLTNSGNRTATVAYNSGTQNLDITFNGNVWGGIGILAI